MNQAEGLEERNSINLINLCKVFRVFDSYDELQSLTYQDTTMSQSISTLYTHATFSTKDRNLWINEQIRDNLHAYMASILKNLNSPALIINSMPDHIHILFRVSKTITIADVMEEVKKSSSKWIKVQPNGVSSFYWQKGYGAFSLSSSHLDVVSRYIANQKEHHKKFTYREEVERLMKKYNVSEYDPKYYWD